MKKLSILFMSALAGFVMYSCNSATNAVEETTEAVESATETVTEVAEEAFQSVKELVVPETATQVDGTVEWYAEKVTGSHNGEVALSQAYITTDDEGHVTGGEFLIDMTSISVLDIPADNENNAKLVGHLKADDFFAVEKYPMAHLKITSVEDGMATADLTIRDKTNPVEFKINHTDAGYATEFTFDRTLFDVMYNSGKLADVVKDKIIYDEVKLTVSVSPKS